MAQESSPAVRTGVQLSSFQSKMLLLGLVLTLAGLAGWVWTQWIQPRNASLTVQHSSESSRSWVDSSATPGGVLTEEENSRSWIEWASTTGFRLGFSLLIGLTVGYVFRMFLKTMAILAALAMTSILLLSYFNLYNLDFTQVEQQWGTHREWITTQAQRLKEVIWTYLPSTSAGFVGFFVGMMRR